MAYRVKYAFDPLILVFFAAAASQASVPEPAGLWMMLVGVLVAYRRE